jgi:hypothetical protein
MIAEGQHTGLAQQVASGDVGSVIIFIGSNDFHTWNGTYAAVYNGSLSDAQLQAKIDRIVGSITTAVDTLQGAGPVDILASNYADPGQAYDFIVAFPDAAKRQRVTQAIATINQRLGDLAASRGIVLANLYDFGDSLLANIDASGNLIVGGELIRTTVHGDEPHHLQLGDSVGHAGTVCSGLIANLFIDALVTGYNYELPRFTEAEILQTAGIVPAVATPSPTEAPAATLTATATETSIPTATYTHTPIPTATHTHTPIPTATHTRTPSPTATQTRTATPTITATPAPIVVYPSVYTITRGSLVSGNSATLVNDDNSYFVLRSTTSGATREINVEYTLTSAAMRSAQALDVTVRLKGSTSQTARIYVYNHSTSSWVQIDSFTLNTSEIERRKTLTTNITQYVPASGQLKLRVNATKMLATFTTSLDKIAVTAR